MPGQPIGSAANRAQIVDVDFDVTPYLTQLKNAGVKTIGRYYDRAYGTGIGEVCYHHKSKTLTKAELDRDRTRGHVRLRDVSALRRTAARISTWRIKATADKGRKDADGRGAAGARSRPARGHADLFRRSISIRIPARTARCRPTASGRASKPYFDQINEVFAQTRWQVGVYGAGVTCKRLKESGKAKYLLALDIARPHRLAGVLQQRRNGICFRTSPRSSAATRPIRSTPTLPIRRQPYFGAVDVARPAPAHDPERGDGLSWPAAHSSRRAASMPDLRRDPTSRATRRMRTHVLDRRAAS